MKKSSNRVLLEFEQKRINHIEKFIGKGNAKPYFLTEKDEDFILNKYPYPEILTTFRRLLYPDYWTWFNGFSIWCPIYGNIDHVLLPLGKMVVI